MFSAVTFPTNVVLMQSVCFMKVLDSATVKKAIMAMEKLALRTETVTMHF